MAPYPVASAGACRAIATGSTFSACLTSDPHAISGSDASTAASRTLETVSAGGRTFYRLHIQAGQVDAFRLDALEAAGRTALRNGRYAQRGRGSRHGSVMSGWS